MKELLRQELVEKLRIQKALAQAGYFAYRIDRAMGMDSAIIHVVSYDPDRHDQALEEAEEKLALV